MFLRFHRSESCLMSESKYAQEEEKDFLESKSGCGCLESKKEEKVSAGDDLMAKAASFCFSQNFISVFEEFIQEHAHVFFSSIDSGETEHRLEYNDLFMEYLELYERTLENWLKREGISLAEFNQELQKAKARGKVSEKYFLKLLVASGEYDCFYDVMMKEARKQTNAR